jgi:WD40 repeat protein
MFLLAFLGACASTVLASAQAASSATDVSQQSGTPSAYVYVVSKLSNNTSELDGYSADSNGALTRLAGSPFWTSNSLYGFALANTTHWLFVSDGFYIYTFSIASNGTLKQVSSVNSQQHDPYGGTSGALILDHTGATLYDYEQDGVGDNFYEFFSKGSNGALTYFGSSDVTAIFGYLAFTGNNEYAYGASCIQLSAAFYGFGRSSDGTLTRLSIDPQLPTNPNTDYCPDGAATDPASNVAIPLFQVDVQGNPFQLSVYTADGSGNLTTNSTYQNMPYTSVGWVNVVAASPAGNLLAVGGASGLQVFHFNGSNPITAYTGLLATHEIWSMAWDNHNHLYGISPSGRLYAFRVTTTGYKQASGSPYTISNPQAITVLSK